MHGNKQVFGHKANRRFALLLAFAGILSLGIFQLVQTPAFADVEKPDSQIQDSADQTVVDQTASTDENKSEGDIEDVNDGPAQSDALPEGTFFITSALSGHRVLDAIGGATAPGTKIQLYGRNETSAQQFEVVDFGDGTYGFLNVKSGLYLSYPSDTSVFATLPTVDLRPLSCDGFSCSWVSRGSAEGWVISPSTDDSYALDIAGGNDSNGASIRLYKCNGTNAQCFTLEKPKQQVLDELAATHASDVPDGTYLIQASGNHWMAFDVAGGSKQNGANIQLYQQNITAAQLWAVEHDSLGYATIVNSGSKLALDVAGGSSRSSANIQQYASNGTKAQKWILIKDASGCVQAVSALDPDLCIDLSGGSLKSGSNIQLWSSNGSNAQRWYFDNLDDARSSLDKCASEVNASIADGRYILNAGAGSRKVFDVSGGSLDNGANVQSYTSNMTAAQQWDVSHTDQGYLVLTNVKSGKVLDVSGGSCALSANIGQYSFNGSRAQLWIALPQGDGFAIESALYPGLVVDVAGGSSQNGANIQLYSSNGTAAQTVRFISTTPSVGPSDDLGLDGWFQISPAQDASKAFDIAGGSSSNGANLQLYASNGTFAQTYRFVYRDGYYQIICAQSGKAIDVDGGNICPGTNAQQWDDNSTNANQRFAVVRNDDNTYSFINAASGLALEAVAGNVQGGAPSQSDSQRFTLSPRTSLLPEGYYSFISKVNGSSVLDVAGGSTGDGANVQLYASNGSTAQKWKVSKVADRDNTYVFESLVSGRVLTADADGNVVVRSLTGSDYQYWSVGVNAGAVTFENVATGLVLDISGGSSSNGANLQVYAANGSKAQSFKLASCSLVDSGVYVIGAASNRSKVLDVSSGSRSNGANVQLWSSNGSGAQKWNVMRQSDGSYVIQNCRSKKNLDVLNAQGVSGSNVQQWASNGNSAQRWYVSYAGNGGFELRSALNNSLVLDIYGGSINDGSNVQIYSANGSNAQHFAFLQSSYSPEPVDLSVPVYNQYSVGLPNGCESAALTNVLNYYGFGVGPCEMADRWIPRSSWDFVWCYWGDPHSYSNGNEISAPGLTKAANNFLLSHGSGLRAYDVSGTSLYDLCNYLDDGYPVIIWTTVNQGNVGNIYARQGNYFACVNSHTVVLKGYDPQQNKVMLSDSISGYTTWDRGWIAWVYAQRGSQAVVIK